MSLLVNLLLGALATTQLVEVLHHGSIFSWLQAWAETTPAAGGKDGWIVRFTKELVNCPFCLSHWGAGLMVALCIVASYLSILFALPVWWLAVTRLSNLINDLTHSTNRLSQPEEEIEINITEDLTDTAANG